MSRYVLRAAQVFLDVAILAVAYVVAFVIRFDGLPPQRMLKVGLFLFPYGVALQLAMLRYFNVHRFSWRHVGLREAMKVFWAIGTCTAVFLAARLVSGAFVKEWGYARYALLPIGVIVINAGLAAAGVLGVRVLRRLWAERVRAAKLGRRPARRRARTLLIGAGEGGLMVVKEAVQRPDLGIKPVAFLDDDPMKAGMVVHGVPVRGTTAEIESLARRLDVEQALITFAHAPGTAIRKVVAACDAVGLPVKIIPELHEVLGGNVNLSRIRDVAIEDLLRREPVHLDSESLSGCIRGKVVVVTGAGGSIGSELCRQLVRFEPMRLVLLEQAENALFEVHRELASHAPDATTLVPCIADVCDAARVDALFADHRPDLVFHAAAHKHVPMMEWNPGEALKNNIMGTRTVADMADRHDVESFVMVSTDKAVNPTSVMGASKRVAEIYVQALDAGSATSFVTVRFGNVLGSNGSVIPIFQRQISAGGPVTVTDPEMCRYFMTIPEACQLVLQAGTMGEGGEIFILDMGEPVKIVDLARDLIRLSGLEPDEDIEIVFTGARPGEKLYEEIAVDEESAAKTWHPKIYVGQTRPNSLGRAHEYVERLVALADTAEPWEVRAVLSEIIEEYRPPQGVNAPGNEGRPATQPSRAVVESEDRPRAGILRDSWPAVAHPVAPQR